MSNHLIERRRFLATGMALAVIGGAGLSVPARAQGLAPTPSMRGGPTITFPVPRSWTGSAMAVSG